MEIASICHRRLGALLPRWVSRSLPRQPETGRQPASAANEGVAPPDPAAGSILIAQRSHGSGGSRRSRIESPVAWSAAAKPPRPLRVLQIIDDTFTPASGAAGRIVISGRMADVCAELDRLAAIESRHRCA